jgi:outer membrane protein assembly factor BamD (BamD/ComL family)
MYEAAMAEYAAGQWSLAITGFDQFIKAFPTSEQADDAQYFIGETHYASGKYPEAISALNQVIQNYPTGNKVADAYFRRGSAQERMKDRGARVLGVRDKELPGQHCGGSGQTEPGSDRSGEKAGCAVTYPVTCPS